MRVIGRATVACKGREAREHCQPTHHIGPLVLTCVLLVWMLADHPLEDSS